jgi:hypothetical protein
MIRWLAETVLCEDVAAGIQGDVGFVFSSARETPRSVSQKALPSGDFLSAEAELDDNLQSVFSLRVDGMSGVISVRDRSIESKSLPLCGLARAVLAFCCAIASVSEQMLKSIAYHGGW